MGMLYRPLEGLRVIFSFFVVSGHVYGMAPIMLDSISPFYALGFINNWFLLLIHHIQRLCMFAAVDYFHFTSGFLLFQSTPARPTSSHIVRTLISRWLRLAPVYLFASFIAYLRGNPNCLSLSEAFFIQNFTSRPAPNFFSHCIPVGWSVPVDVQAHLLLLILLSLNPRIRNYLWPIVFLAGIFRLVTWFTSGRPSWPPGISVMFWFRSPAEKLVVAKEWLLPAGNFDPSDEFFTRMRQMAANYDHRYFGFWYRFSAVFFGAAVANDIHTNALFTRLVRKYTNVMLACAPLLWGLFFYSDVLNQMTQSKAWHVSASEGFGRIFVMLGIAIVVIATCATDVQSRLARALKRVLGCDAMLWLGKKSYAIYLLHPLCMWCFTAVWPKLAKDAFTHERLLANGVKLWLVTLAVAIPVSWAEQRLMTMRRRLIGGGHVKKVD